jgi:predicted transglutaminase-like cysteine proteinase
MGQALAGRTKPCARTVNACNVHISIAGAAAAAFLTLSLLFPHTTRAQTLASLPVETSPLAGSGPVEPIRAWVELCRHAPHECAVDASENGVIALTAEVWQTLLLVNRSVNERIMAITDREHWGIEDRWNIPNDGFGDCEDIQLLKRKELIDRGLPRRALRMTVVMDEDGDGHAVLMVRTDRGDLILDNRRSAILPWTKTGYVYIKREGQDGRDWVSLGGISSPLVTANAEDSPQPTPAPLLSPARVASR